MKAIVALVLVFVCTAVGQDIVLKSTFGGSLPLDGYASSRTVVPMDVNDDGIKEQPVNCTHLLDATNLHLYCNPLYLCGYCWPNIGEYVTSIRRDGLAEWVMLGGIIDWSYYRIFDIQTNELLLQIPCEQGNSRLLAMDYDLDGRDDLVVGRANGTIEVYGIDTGNPPISPPQELDIQQVGEDFVISWTSVPNTTAYRVEWSSALDGGVRFTRIGYTTGTTFTHRNQVGQERGFYRVLSEDNGMGVIRIVGQGR